jgi:hypothetical protein
VRPSIAGCNTFVSLDCVIGLVYIYHVFAGVSRGVKTMFKILDGIPRGIEKQKCVQVIPHFCLIFENFFETSREYALFSHLLTI